MMPRKPRAQRVAATFLCGHPRTPENIYELGQNGLVCRECHRLRMRDRSRRKAAAKAAAAWSYVPEEHRP